MAMATATQQKQGKKEEQTPLQEVTRRRDSLKNRIEQAEKILEGKKTETAQAANEITSRVRADATGEKAYSEKSKIAHQQAHRALRNDVEDLARELDGLHSAVPQLESNVLEAEAAEIRVRIEANRKQWVEAVGALEKAWGKFIKAADEYMAVVGAHTQETQEYGRVSERLKALGQENRLPDLTALSQKNKGLVVWLRDHGFGFRFRGPRLTNFPDVLGK